MAANTVLVVGEAGSGKSTSIENLPIDQTFIVNVSSKPLPFKGWKSKYTELSKDNPMGNMLSTDNADGIVKALEYISSDRLEIKYVIIDDSQYVAANEFMRRAKDVGYQKFVDIALNIFKLPTATKKLRDDMFVFFLSHLETISDSEGNLKNKAKTLGKMIDDKITYEGLFAIVLFTYREEVRDGTTEYGFITNGDPRSTAKSPKGMFATAKIPNDLMAVVNAIKEYES